MADTTNTQALTAARGVLAATAAALAESESRATAMDGVYETVAAHARRASEALEAARIGTPGSVAALAEIARRAQEIVRHADHERRGQWSQAVRLRGRVETLTTFVALMEEAAKRQRSDVAAIVAQEARKVPLVRTSRDAAVIADELRESRDALAATEAALAAMPARLEPLREREERARSDVATADRFAAEIAREKQQARSKSWDAANDPDLEARSGESDRARQEARSRHETVRRPLVQLEGQQGGLKTQAGRLRTRVAQLEEELAAAQWRDEQRPGWLTTIARRVGVAV